MDIGEKVFNVFAGIMGTVLLFLIGTIIVDESKQRQRIKTVKANCVLTPVYTETARKTYLCPKNLVVD